MQQNVVMVIGDYVFFSAMTIIFTLVTVSRILFPFFCWCLASCVLIEAYNRCMSRIRELWLSIYFIFFIYLLRVVSLSRKSAFSAILLYCPFCGNNTKPHYGVLCSQFYKLASCCLILFLSDFCVPFSVRMFLLNDHIDMAGVCNCDFGWGVQDHPSLLNCCLSRIFANLSTQANYDLDFMKCKYFFCNGKIGRILN